MAIWLTRAGSHGEYEQKFITDQRVYVTWEQLNVDLSKLADRTQLLDAMRERYPDAKPKALANWAGQVWPFAHDMAIGDLVVVPLKNQPVVYIGRITGDYQFDATATDPYYHSRTVQWIGEAIPRSHFEQDLLYSFGAFMTICRIRRNNAEARLQAMSTQGWKPETIAAITSAPKAMEDETDAPIDLEQLGQDQITQLIGARFKGHGLTRLVDSILKAQGYTTYVSPEGADGGADILAGSGPLGFGNPRLCVQVKSESSPIDRPTVDKLLGAVTKFRASEGLFVSWSGFKNNVQKDYAPNYFKIRLWTSRELLFQLFALYDQLDEDIRAELPLKRIWTVAAQEEE